MGASRVRFAVVGAVLTVLVMFGLCYWMWYGVIRVLLSHPTGVYWGIVSCIVTAVAAGLTTFGLCLGAVGLWALYEYIPDCIWWPEMPGRMSELRRTIIWTVLIFGSVWFITRWVRGLVSKPYDGTLLVAGMWARWVFTASVGLAITAYLMFVVMILVEWANSRSSKK